jgi:hypothetical protein
MRIEPFVMKNARKLTELVNSLIWPQYTNTIESKVLSAGNFASLAGSLQAHVVSPSKPAIDACLNDVVRTQLFSGSTAPP